MRTRAGRRARSLTYGGSSPPPAFYSISSRLETAWSREDSAVRMASQPPERERSAAACTKHANSRQRTVHPRSGKDESSQPRTMRLRATFVQSEGGNHAIRHHGRLDRSRGRRVRAADSQGIGRQDAATFRYKVNRPFSLTDTSVLKRRPTLRKNPSLRSVELR